METREELRDELMAILGASRELSPHTDAHLAGEFMRRVDKRLAAGRTIRKQHPPVSVILCKFVRDVLSIILVLLVLAPIIAFLINFPEDGVLRHIDAGAIPPLYYVAVLFLVLCILATMFLERHSVHVQIRRRSKDGRTALNRA